MACLRSITQGQALLFPTRWRRDVARSNHSCVGGPCSKTAVTADMRKLCLKHGQDVCSCYGSRKWCMFSSAAGAQDCVLYSACLVPVLARHRYGHQLPRLRLLQLSFPPTVYLSVMHDFCEYVWYFLQWGSMWICTIVSRLHLKHRMLYFIKTCSFEHGMKFTM